jgi:hypothetical protein
MSSVSVILPPLRALPSFVDHLLTQHLWSYAFAIVCDRDRQHATAMDSLQVNGSFSGLSSRKPH